MSYAYEISKTAHAGRLSPSSRLIRIRSTAQSRCSLGFGGEVHREEIWGAGAGDMVTPWKKVLSFPPGGSSQGAETLRQACVCLPHFPDLAEPPVSPAAWLTGKGKAGHSVSSHSLGYGGHLVK